MSCYTILIQVQGFDNPVTRDYATSKVLAKALLGIYFPETLQRLVYATPIDRQIESFVGTIKEIEGALKLNTKEVAALVDKLSKVGIVFQSLPAGGVEGLPGSGGMGQGGPQANGGGVAH